MGDEKAMPSLFKRLNEMVRGEAREDKMDHQQYGGVQTSESSTTVDNITQAYIHDAYIMHVCFFLRR